MKEKELIQIIKSSLNSRYIGDDCAYLSDLGIVITQDSLVEDVHFKLSYTKAYEVGWKSIAVNISDICASGAEPAYLTVALSLPEYINTDFVKEFYKGAKDAAGNAKIVGGDITGSDKLYVSVCAVGKTSGRRISSRSNAKPEYKIVVSNEHGNSAKGLKLLLEGKNERNKFTKAHLTPTVQEEFSRQIAQNINTDYAMADTSDGLADALMQIAASSGLKLCIETSKIPHDPSVDLETVLYGGEDYGLVAAVPQNFETTGTIIGKARKGQAGLEIDRKFYGNIDDKIYNHFKGEK